MNRTPDLAGEKLLNFAHLIHQWNSKINLTGYKTIEEILANLINESVEALYTLNLSSETVLDFGSGAGIPGLVWACCNPGLRVTSLEVRQKKVAFQKEVLRTLEIKAEIVTGLFPEALAGRQFDVIVSRAIRFDPSLWAAGKSLLGNQGRFVRFASPGTMEPGWQSLNISPKTCLLILQT